MEKRYTIKEFKKYLATSDSLGDAMHYLSEERMESAGAKSEVNEFRSWLGDMINQTLEDAGDESTITEIIIEDVFDEVLITFSLTGSNAKHEIEINKETQKITLHFRGIYALGQIGSMIKDELEERVQTILTLKLD